MQTFAFILGRDTDLSITELKSILPQKGLKIKEFTNTFLLAEGEIQNSQEILDELGGSIKIFEITDLGDLNNPDDIRQSLYEKLLEELSRKERKHFWGVSVFDMPKKELKTILIGAKKFLKEKGLSARFVNKNFDNLNSASTVKEGLLRLGNAELALFEIKSHYFLGVCTAVQDIDEYSVRDYGRPARSAKKGMLPPKLAQIMLNLAGVKSGDTIYDPFCGSGTVLTEALYKKCDVIGSDIDEEQVEDTRTNTAWIKKKFNLQNKVDCFVHDIARPFPDLNFDAIVTEGYLGTPLSSAISSQEAEKSLKKIQKTYSDFLKNITPLLKTGNRICITFPFIFSRENKEVVFDDNFLSEIENDFDFEKDLLPSPSARPSILYRRSGQFVGREIFVLKKK